MGFEGLLLLFEELILTRGCSSGLVGFCALGSKHWFSSEKKIFFHLKNCQECLSQLLWAMAQLQLIAIDNSGVNPPEKLSSDRGALPGRAGKATDSGNCGFHL